MKNVLIIFGITILLASCKLNGTEEWVKFRGNIENTGYTENDATIELKNLKWKFETGDEIYSSPAIAEGNVFFGSDDGYLYAVNLLTGQEKWKFKTEDWVESSPAIAKGIVFFGSSDGYLYAVNLLTGQEKWKFKTEDGVYSSPAIAEGNVFFGSSDGYLYAVE